MKKSFLISLIIFTVSVSTLQAQQKDSVEQSKKAIDLILSTEQLNVIDGNPKTFYSSGYEVRAQALQHLMHNCIAYYEANFPADKFAVPLYVLNKPDWTKPPLGHPYGMPFYTPDNVMMFVAAEKNALRKLTGLPDDPEKSDSVLSTFDFQPVHELGHYFFFTLNNVYKEKWLNEFLATYFLICFIKENNLAPELEKALQTNFPVAHKSLDDFDKLYGAVGTANYHWYQSKFAQLGFTLYPQFRLELIKIMLKNYGAHGKNLDGLTLLKSQAPQQMDAWLEQMQ